MREAMATMAALALAALVAASCGDGEPSGPRVRMVLEPEEGVQVEDLDVALAGVQEIIERRAQEFGLRGISIQRMDETQVMVEVPGVAPDDAVRMLGRTALLQLCEPVTNATGDVATAPEGVVRYKAQSCEPERDVAGNIIVEGGVLEFVPWYASNSPRSRENPSAERIVWQPAAAEIDGREVALTGHFLRSNTFVSLVGPVNQPALILEWNDIGSAVSEHVTGRLAERNYPLALYLDGEPIRDSNNLIIAPRVQATITSQGTITGLAREDAEELSTLLNIGPFPLPMRVVEAREVAQ